MEQVLRLTSLFSTLILNLKSSTAIGIHKKWAPEYAGFSKYPKPIIDHGYAREVPQSFKETLTQYLRRYR
jgi:hypothetical protein